MPIEIIETKDASNTLYLPELNEHYHSTHGAVTESKHIYIANGLEKVKHLEHIRVLEVGFGTGLNAALSVQWAEVNQKKIAYTSLEPFPLPLEVIQGLNYPKQIPLSMVEAEQYYGLHKAPFETEMKVHPFFKFTKINQKLQDYRASMEFDVLFYDAFAPEKQPDLWTFEVLKKACYSLVKGGILTTYCCKGSVRRLLTELGLTVYKTKGPEGGKREVIYAVKK